MAYSCRTESLNDDQTSETQKNPLFFSKVIPLDESIHKSKLQKELQVAKLQLNKTHFDSKGVVVNFNNSTISTSNVKYFESGAGFHTYTFKIDHPDAKDNDPLENLVLTSMPDGTYREFLISYNLTSQEKKTLMLGGNVSTKDKYSITELTSGASGTSKNQNCNYIQEQAYTWCSDSVHHHGEPKGNGPGQCKAETQSQLINVYLYVCESVEDDTDNPPYNGYYPAGENGVFTSPFISIGYQYYLTEDLDDPNYIHYTNVANFFTSLGTEINQLRVTNPDLFYHTFFYFQQNGINTTTKTFITERLTTLNSWYINANADATASQTANQYFLNWAFNYLLNINPDATIEQFQDWFIDTPLTNQTLQNELMEDWIDPNRVKPTTRFKSSAKLNSIYNKIKTASNFKQYLQNFEPTFSVAHLMFDVGAVTKPDAIAQTKEPINYWIKITFNQNWDYASTPKIILANAFMHEMVHAEMFRKLLTLAPNNGNFDLNLVLGYLNNNNYVGMFDYYIRFSSNNTDVDHEIMGAHYINIMVNFLKQVYSSHYTDLEYRAVAWLGGGLKGTRAWNLLPQSEKTLLENTYQNNYYLWEL
ncbi:hypothetical protein [Chryseobacterium piscicola]|nr:hypothetical protein [Chryseobacterium piscicola]